MINIRRDRDGQSSKLRAIQPRVVWGSLPLGNYRSCIIALAEHEYIMTVGSGLLFIDNNTVHSRNAKLVDMTFDVEHVTLLTVSRDYKFFAAAVSMAKDNKLGQSNNESVGEVNILIYNTSARLVDGLMPRLVKFSVGSQDSAETQAMGFSHDCSLLAVATNIPEYGIVILEQYKGTVYQTIQVENVINSISFHPSDSTKLCVTGENNLLKFWRFTNKSAHVAPVTGLRKGEFSYTCHAWIQPFAETTIVAGSSGGFVVIVQNCEQRAAAHQSFPWGEAVNQILVKADNVIVTSSTGRIVLYEIRRVLGGKGSGSERLTATLGLLACYQIRDIQRLSGLQFTAGESVTSFSMMACTDIGIFAIDPVTDQDLGGNEANSDWRTIDAKKVLFSYHSSPVCSLNVSSRGKTFVTATNSPDDATIRLWDLESPSGFSSSWLVESFRDHLEDAPIFVDIHPGGLQVAVATEKEIRECAIGDSQLESIRRFSVRTPFIGSSGSPVVISQPVSLVRYSNGGHLLAVVTGKVVQIFHTYMPDFDSLNTGQDIPSRVMSLCDHVAPVTDLIFLRGDSRIITTANDGSVYSWILGQGSREREYIAKGAHATHVVASKHHQDKCTIVASFVQSAALTESIVPTAATTLPTSASSHPHGNTMRRRREQVATKTDLNVPLHPDGASPVVGANGVSDRQNFLAVWENNIEGAPQIVYLDGVVRALAVGRTEGTDGADICTIGYADGRIVVCCLPFPLIKVQVDRVSATSSLRAISSAIVAISGKGGKLQRRKSAQFSSDDDSTAISTATGQSSQSNRIKRPTIIANESPLAAETGESGATVGQESSKEQEKSEVSHVLDSSKSRSFRLVSSVAGLSITLDGRWIILSGEDGVVILLSTVFDKIIDEDSNSATAQEKSHEPVPQFFMVDRTRIQLTRAKLVELELSLEQSKRENDLYISKLLEGKEKLLSEQETRLKKEIQKRDETILSGRKEYLNMKRSMQLEIDRLVKGSEESLKGMEVMYEKKLAEESLYLEKMKQAYDEYVVHTRLDMGSLSVQAENKVREMEIEKSKALQEAERQKAAVLAYYSYIKNRHAEVMDGLEETQAEERLRMMAQISSSSVQVADLQAASLSAEVMHNCTVNRLATELQQKDVEVLKINSDIEWANDRISKLETALQQATVELRIRSELVDKNAVKMGEMTKRVEDLEKIRKTLTVQLNALQGDLVPKEKEMQRMGDKLQETTREYEVALNAITEKEKILDHKTENLLLLQKQVRDLRTTSTHKDAALARAAILLQEFMLSMVDARFAPQKKDKKGETVSSQNNQDKDKEKSESNDADLGLGMSGASKNKRRSSSSGDPRSIVTALQLDDVSEVRLKRLHDLLKPFLSDRSKDAEFVDEAEAVRREQERQLHMLHRNFSSLQSSIDTMQMATHNKISNHLSDNQTLLREVNALRSEVKSLSLENQRLVANLDFSNGRNGDQRSQNLLDSSYEESFHDPFRSSIGRIAGQQTAQTIKKPLLAMDRNANSSRGESALVSNRESKSGLNAIDVGLQSSSSQIFPVALPPLQSSSIGTSKGPLAQTPLSTKPPSSIAASAVSKTSVAGNKSVKQPNEYQKYINSLTEKDSNMSAEQKIAAIIELNSRELKMLHHKK